MAGRPPPGTIVTGRRVRAVVFDLDGTLVDTMISMPEAYARTVRALGGRQPTRGQVVAAWRLGATSAVLGHLLGRPVSPGDLAVFDAHVADAVATVRPFPGVVDLLSTLLGAGYRLGVFTGAARRTAGRLLTGAGLERYFPVVVGGDDVARPKPAPDGLLLACRLLGVDARHAAYVGDADVDRRCAAAAGALAVHAGWGAGGPETPAGVLAVLPGDAPGDARRDGVPPAPGGASVDPCWW